LIGVYSSLSTPGIKAANLCIGKSLLAMGHTHYLCVLACLSLQIVSAIPLAEEFNDLVYEQVPNLITAMAGYDVSKSTPYSKHGDKGSLSPIFNPIYTEDGDVFLQDFISKAGEEVLCEKTFSTKSITSYSDYRKEKGSSMEFSAGGSVSASGWGVEAKVGYEYGETKEDKEVLDMFETNQGEIVMTTLSCSVYIVEIATFIKPVFMENFINGMGVLANGALSFDPIKKKKNFLLFLANFGTHYQKQTRLGAKMIYEKRFTKRSKSKGESVSRSECAKHAASASVGGNYAGFGGSVEGHGGSEKCSDQANSSNDTDNSFDTESKLISVGILPTDLSDWENAIKNNDQKPLPLSRKLDLITQLFTPRNLEGLTFKNEETGVEESLNGALLSNFYKEQYEKEFLATYPQERYGCGLSGSCKIGQICTNEKSSKTGFTCSKKEILWRSYHKFADFPSDALQLGDYSIDGNLYVGRISEHGEVGKINMENWTSGRMWNFYTHHQGHRTSGEILCGAPNSVKWMFFRKGDPIPKGAIRAGWMDLDGDLYIGKPAANNEIGKINTDDGKLYNLWTHAQGKFELGFILVLN